MATDEAGNELGAFDTWEKTRSVGIGISLSEWLLSRTSAANTLRGRLARAGDLAVGLTLNRVTEMLAPDWALPPDISPGAGSGKGTGLDGGVLLRLTPYNSIDSLGWFRPEVGWLDPVFGGFRFDASAGCSWLSFLSSKIKFGDLTSDPMPSHYRLSAGACAAMGFPGVARDWLRDQGAGLLAASLTPLIQFGAAWDRTKGTVYDNAIPVYGRGWELTVANIYSIRRGHINDRAGDVRDDTRGTGIGFRLGKYAGFRYDTATTPQSRVLRDHKISRKGWTAQIDPWAIWRDLGR